MMPNFDRIIDGRMMKTGKVLSKYYSALNYSVSVRN